MKVTIICVGRLKETYWQAAVAEYSKRLGRYVKLTIHEVADEKTPETMSAAEGEAVRKKEGERILKAVKEDAFVVALAIEGKQFSSKEMAELIENSGVRGVSHMTFIIGGSLGLSAAVMKRCDLAMSFSRITFPHQMMRVVLLEQIYRGMKIIKKEPYHK